MKRGKRSTRQSFLRNFSKRRARLLAKVQAGEVPEEYLSNLDRAFAKRATLRLLGQ